MAADLHSPLDAAVNAALGLWRLPAGATARLINIAENETYLVEAPDGHRAVLRVHREGYHTKRAIEYELAWLDALRASGKVTTARYFTGTDGAAIQVLETPNLSAPRFMVLFHFIEGAAPDETGDLSEGFEELGAIAARCHLHAMAWVRPQPFERLTWDVNAVLGPNPIWGDWRAAPEVTPEITAALERVETTLRARLHAYGKGADRYGLIHADMRLANLLVDAAGTRLIDFDDCGFGWFLYDFAAAISFIEDNPRIPAYKAAWLRGYQTVRALSAADLAEIDSFVMLRRLALLAWIGSRIDAPEPQALAPGFAATTARLGQAWLDGI